MTVAKKAFVIITSSEEGKAAYGITTDDDKSVYVPPGIADALELDEFDEIEAILIQNDRENIPYKAIRARRVGEETVDTQVAD